MSNDKSIYDELIPFFGNADDQRVRLFLYTMLHKNLNLQSCRFLQHSSVWDAKPDMSPILKLDNTIDPDNKTSNNNNDNNTDPEWYIFSKDLVTRLVEKEDRTISTPGKIQQRITKHEGKQYDINSIEVKILNSMRTQSGLSHAKVRFHDIFTFLTYFVSHINTIKINDYLAQPNVLTLEITSFKFNNYKDLTLQMLNLFDSCSNQAIIRYDAYSYNQINLKEYETIVAMNEYKKYINRTTFSYKIGKHVAFSMLEEAKDEPIHISPSGSKFLDSLDMDTSIPKYEYYRKSDDPSKLYTKDKDGKEIDVSKNSNKFWEEAKNETNCNGFHVSPNDKNRCTDYLAECIKGTDPTKCRIYMAEATFWGDKNGIKKEVIEMLPTYALKTLKTFGFEQVHAYDSIAKINIVKMERLQSWLERLRINMVKDDPATGPGEFSKILNNTTLTLYLSLLIQKLDESPAILNETYTGKTEESSAYNPNRFNGTLLSQIGLFGKLPSGNNCDILAKNNRLAALIRENNMSRKYGPHFIVNVKRGAMMGGAIELDSNYKYAAIVLEKQYEAYINILKAHGKEIAPDQDNILKTLLSSLKNTENKLFQSMKLFEKYIELIDVHQYNDPNKVLNLDTLNIIVNSNNKLLNKTNTKQAAFMEMMATIAASIQEVVSKKAAAGAEVTAVTGPTGPTIPWPKNI